MGKENKIFQYAVLGGFILLGVASVIVFAMYRSSSSVSKLVPITIWGTLDAGAMGQTILDLQKTYPELGKVTYSALSPNDYTGQLTQAFSEGRGPDLYIIDQSQLVGEFPKLTPISYKTLAERNFRDTFFDATNVFLSTEGILGLPLVADPLVMYWNKDIFTNAGFVEPPKYWDEFFVMAPKITVRDNEGKITTSMVALGDYDNISHAKEIISALMFAAGSPIVRWGTSGHLEVALSTNIYGTMGSPAEAALRYYTEFSNPIKTAYSWHKNMPYSRDAFLSGDLAVYFGFASEVQELRSANPNLNFDIAILPQSRTAPRRSTYTKVFAFVVPKTSKSSLRSYQIASILSGQKASQAIATKLGLAPVRRDLLSIPSTSAYGTVVNQSAIIGKTWLEPNARGVSTAFARMIDAVTSGRTTVQTAVNTANEELKHLLQ